MTIVHSSYAPFCSDLCRRSPRSPSHAGLAIPARPFSIRLDIATRRFLQADHGPQAGLPMATPPGVSVVRRNPTLPIVTDASPTSVYWS